MTDAPRRLNRSALALPYAQPAFGNPVSSLMESGVGNCFPGLEFDLRQLDARFFPGLVFEFPGVTPDGPDGTQGAHLLYVETYGDGMLGGSAPWVATLNGQYGGDEGAALASGDWYLHSVEQHGKKIELYTFTVYENTITATPFEGDTCWWIIRLIEADPDHPDVADLTVTLTQRTGGVATGMTVKLKGKRRLYLNADGMIDEVYNPGELTSSMCSPWTHDFTDCGCQYWAANHPDVALGPVPAGDLGSDDGSLNDPLQPVTLLDWLRRRNLPSTDVSAPTTIDAAQSGRYDHYEINQRWEELDFVLQGEEMDRTPIYPNEKYGPPYGSLDELIDDLETNLAPLEFTLSMEYLYAYFSLRAPEEVSKQEAARWPTLVDDLRAAGELLLSAALSEMTHMRWDNQILWTLDQEGLYPKGKRYVPVVKPSRTVPNDGNRPRALRSATCDVLSDFQSMERPSGDLDREYARIVEYFRSNAAGLPPGLDEIAIRIDSDGMQHYHKFRDALAFLSFYAPQPDVYLRRMRVGTPGEAKAALAKMKQVIRATTAGYVAERRGDMDRARDSILEARAAMRELQKEAEKLAKAGLGVPFFALFEDGNDDG